jgi:MFS family permease
MWLITNNPLGILLGPQLLGGIGWTAFNLATSNFIYDNIPSEKRGEYIALYNFLNGLGIITGGLIGGILISFLTITFMNEFCFLFLLSGILRLLIVIFFLPRIKEVRVHETKPIFNLKNGHLYHWLYDISVRDHRERRKIRIK